MHRPRMARAAVMSIVAGSLIVAGARTELSGAPNQEPLVGGIHWARGEERPPEAGRTSRSPNLTYHGGTVMHGTFVEPIFWGTSWSNSSFVGDKVSGLTLFFSGIGGSSYAGTTSEYTDGTGHVGTGVTFGATHFDFSTATANGQQTGPVLAEVCKEIASPVADGYYPVYIDQKRGRAKFCAWHSTGSCGAVQVQFAFFFNLDGDSGCDPQDGSGQHSQGLSALANVSGHELSETLTDNHLNAWYDANGSENADKCAWTFGTPLLTFNNGSEWKIQGNWSNAAFNSGTGYPNSSGQKACLDGGNYK